MKILLFNQIWFSEVWRDQGIEVLTAGEGEQFDIPLPSAFVDVRTVIHGLPQGFAPDVVVFHDDSRPIVYAGFAGLEIPAVFYSVDTHHHGMLHRHIAPCFDHLFTAQKDFTPLLGTSGRPTEWLPLWASQRLEPSAHKEFDAVFVGTLNPDLNPDRVEFFRQLAAKAPVHCVTGDFKRYYPHAHLVLNQTVRGDLNFRVFEALMSGSLLITEHTANGLTDLFTPNEHLVLYSKGNVDEVAEYIRYYLAHPDEAARIGAAGRNLICAAHTTEHRAATVLSTLTTLQKIKGGNRWLGEMANFAALGDNIIYQDPAAGKTSYALALKALNTALREGETLDESTAMLASSTCLKFDRLTDQDLGATLLYELAEAFPQFDTLFYLKTRILAHRGRIDLATELLATRGIQELALTLSKVDHLAETLISGGQRASKKG